MVTSITDKERKEMEDFIKKHTPYYADDPVLQWFDNDDERDQDRMTATRYKFILDGKLDKTPKP